MGEIEATIMEMEDKAWAANRNGDAGWYDRLLADDVVAVSQWGVQTERDQILRIFEENRNPYVRTDLSERRVLLLSDDVALHTSKVEIEIAMEGGERVIRRAYSTTVYVQTAGEWRSPFFQQTEILAE